MRIHRGNLPPRPVSIPTTLHDNGTGYTVLLMNIYSLNKMLIISITRVNKSIAGDNNIFLNLLVPTLIFSGLSYL